MGTQGPQVSLMGLPAIPPQTLALCGRCGALAPSLKFNRKHNLKGKEDEKAASLVISVLPRAEQYSDTRPYK